MTLTSVRLTVALCLVGLVAAPARSQEGARSQEPGQLAIPIGNRGSLELTLPVGWRHEIQQPPGGASPTIQLIAASDPMSGGMLVTPLWISAAKGDALSADQVSGRLSIDAEDLGAGPKPALMPLAGTTGYWFTHRDPGAPRDPDDFEYMTRVHVALGDVDLTATILAHVEDSPMRKAGLAMLSSARIVPGAPRPIPVAMASPGASWSLRFDLPATFAVSGVQRSDTPAVIAVKGGTEDGWNFTAFMEPNPDGKSAVAWRDAIAERSRKLPKEMAGKGVVLGEVKTWEDGARALLTYSLAAPGDMSFRSWNIVMVRDQLWIDIHLSRSPHGPADHAVFDALARSVRFEGGSK